MKNILYRVLCGFCLGISVFAPGISGSVMAIIMGIYNRLIDIVSNPLKNFKKNIIFLFPMGIGALISLVLFVLVFSYLFDAYEKATYLLFIGLIAGNIPLIYKEILKNKFKLHYLIGIVITFAVAFIMGISSDVIANMDSNIFANNLIYLGICGAIAGFASLIPGMSISMILIVLGVYDELILYARNLDIIVLAVVGIAFVLAMILSSRLIKFIFKRYNGFANSMVLGFLCGSIAGICFTLPASQSNIENLLGPFMLLAGLGISFLFVYLGKKMNLNSD